MVRFKLSHGTHHTRGHYIRSYVRSPGSGAYADGNGSQNRSMSDPYADRNREI